MNAKLGRLFFVLAFPIAMFGCNGAWVQREHSNARQALLSLYEEHLFDNLIRADEYLPIVHMDYGDVTSVATGQAKLTLDGTRTDAENHFIAGAAPAIARTLTYTAHPTFEGFQNDALTVNGAPAEGPYVNNAYVSYLNEFVQKTTDSKTFATGATTNVPLKISPPPTRAGATTQEAPKVLLAPPSGQMRANLRHATTRPPPEQVHHGLIKKVDGEWYWIPKSAAPRFFVLFQETTFVRPANPAAASNNVTNQLELLRLNDLSR